LEDVMGVVDDIYEGGGAKPVSWEDVGQTVEGEILAIRSKQLPKFGTEIPETWEDGSPKKTPIVTLQLDGEFEGEDDGKRDIYLRGNAFTAFGQALREAFKAKPNDDELIGSTLKIQFYKTEKSGKGQPRKLFRARITRKAPTVAADSWDAPAEESAPPPPPAASSSNRAKPSPVKPAAPPPGAGPDEDLPF
jgi:hypothetical protein